MTVVSAQYLSLTFQTADAPVHALKDVSLDIAPGEFVSFIGPSGCGKTTFLRVIADLEQPTGGAITVNGMTPADARKARAYGYVFQAASLQPWRTIEKNIALPLEIMGTPGADRQKRVAECWNWSNCPASPRNIRGNCPVACSNVPPSPARWPSTPTCC